MSDHNSDSDPNASQDAADSADSDTSVGTNTDNIKRDVSDVADVGPGESPRRERDAEDSLDDTEESGPASSAEITAVIDAVQLKDERRTGWQLRGVSEPESVAAHSWGVAYLCMVFADRATADFAARGRELDPDRAVRLAVVHDLAEAQTGDIPTRADTTAQTPAPEQTHTAEKTAMDTLTGPLPDAVRRSWDDYERRESPEAVFVKEMDLVEMCFQALVYEREDRYDPLEGDPDAFQEYDALDEFFATAEPRFQTTLGHELFEQIQDRYEAARSHTDSQ